MALIPPAINFATYMCAAGARWGSERYVSRESFRLRASYRYGSPVSRANLAPGDVVFFNGLGHNGIYIGGGQFIHAPHTGDVVKISSMNEGWYLSTYVGARRM